jgi:hypothetical protein
MRWTHARRGERGEIDAMDVGGGVALLILVPVLCLVIAGMLGLSTRSDKGDFREKPQTDPTPDQAEIELRWKAADDLYRLTAKPFAETAVSQSSVEFKEYFRRWATRSLEQTDSSLQSLEVLVRRPDCRGTFDSYLARIGQLREELRRDLERVRALDVLGRDAGS